MTTWDDRTRTAYHESGHFVVAHLLPCRILRISAITIREDPRYHGGLVCENDPWFGRRDAEALCQVLVAGYEAETLLTGAPEPRAALTDLTQLRDLARQMEDEPEAARKLRVAIHQRARTLLRLRWNAVISLAQELLSRETVEACEAAWVVDLAVAGG